MYSIIANGKTFKIDVNVDVLIKDAVDNISWYDDDTYKNGNNEFDIPPVTELEHSADIQRMVTYLEEFREGKHREDIIESMGKKKDGWLAKNRVSILIKCETTKRVSEEEYGYRIFCLRVKAVSSDTVELFALDEIIKW